jgi:hypothetical protein
VKVEGHKPFFYKGGLLDAQKKRFIEQALKPKWTMAI